MLAKGCQSNNQQSNKEEKDSTNPTELVAYTTIQTAHDHAQQTAMLLKNWYSPPDCNTPTTSTKPHKARGSLAQQLEFTVSTSVFCLAPVLFFYSFLHRTTIRIAQRLALTINISVFCSASSLLVLSSSTAQQQPSQMQYSYSNIMPTHSSTRYTTTPTLNCRPHEIECHEVSIQTK